MVILITLVEPQREGAADAWFFGESADLDSQTVGFSWILGIRRYPTIFLGQGAISLLGAAPALLTQLPEM